MQDFLKEETLNINHLHTWVLQCVRDKKIGELQQMRDFGHYCCDTLFDKQQAQEIRINIKKSEGSPVDREDFKESQIP